MNIKNQKLLILSGLFLLLIALPAVMFVASKPQESRSRATASTTMYLTPAAASNTPLIKNVGDTISYDVMINPGNNLPTIVKMELDYDATLLQSVSFVPNTVAFPTIIEGPIYNNGSILMAMSIGSDSTKAIQTTTKVGSVTFTAKAVTTSPTIIGFGPKTSILSAAATDQANENVLSNNTPSYLTINNPAVNTITVTPIPTATPTATPTPTPTLTPIPTSFGPTATPSAKTMALTIFLHSIGNSGDNVNPNQFSFSNKNPLHPTVPIDVFIYNTLNQLTASATGTITYASTSGNYLGTVDFPNQVPDGLFTVKVRTPGHLRKLISGIQVFHAGQNDLPSVALVAGDVNGDNIINILDYNMIINCYSDLQAAASCTNSIKTLTDLNDDNAVDQIDYNLFLREISVQNGN
jgi:hypothetical protein